WTNDSRAARRSSPKGTSDSGGIIASACSGLFSRCVPQYGHFSVTTLSSRSTVAPHPPQRTCDDRPATVVPPASALFRYSSKSRSTTSPPSDSGTVVVWPQYGHLRPRERGSNSTLAPQLAQGNSRPAGGALVSAGGFSTGGAFGFGRGGGPSGMARVL